MRALKSSIPLVPETIVVWFAMLALGCFAWLTSGTPVVGGLIVVALLLAAASPAGSLYATCAAIPLIFHPIAVGSLQLGLLEIGILVSTAGFSLRMVYLTVANRSLPPLNWLLPYLAWALPILLFVIGTMSILTMPFDMHRAEALRSWRWVIFEPLLIFALARWSIARNGSEPLTVAIVVPAAIVALAAIWQIGQSSSSFKVDDVERATATYLHPNNLALYLERAFFLALIPGLLGTRRARWPLRVVALVIAVGIVATFSRGALIGLLAGAAVFLLAHPLRFGWRVLSWISLMAIGLFLLLAGQRFTGAGSSGILSTRAVLWRDSASMIRDFPLAGIGMDQFLWLHQGRYIDPRIWRERYVSHPHNLGLDAWLSLGFPGLVLLLAFVLAGAWFVWRIRSRRRPANPWQLGALACLGAGLGHGLVDNGYFLADLSAMTWLAIAMLVTSDQAQPKVSLVQDA